MKTVRRIRFTGPDVVNVQQVLAAADCGPDVATYEDVPVLRLVFAEVTLEESDARIQRLKALLAPDRSNWDEWHEDKFTGEELETAPLILLAPNAGCSVDGGVLWGTTFDLTGACPVCATGCRQTSALFIDGQDVAKLEGHRAAQTYFWHLLIDDSLANALEDASVTGMSLRSVYAVMPDRRQVKLRWKQLLSENVLPRWSPSTSGMVRERHTKTLAPCEVCGRNGFLTTSVAPTRVVYRASELRHALDVNSTWENYWSASVDKAFQESVLSRPWTVVTSKVYRIFREAGVTELDYHPIRVEEG